MLSSSTRPAKVTFYKWAIPGLFSLFSSFQHKCSLKVCQCLDSNHGSLVSEATTLPTEPQPLPKPKLRLPRLFLRQEQPSLSCALPFRVSRRVFNCSTVILRTQPFLPSKQFTLYKVNHNVLYFDILCGHLCCLPCPELMQINNTGLYGT